MSKKSNVLTLDSYSTRGKRENKLARADNIYSSSYIGFILTLTYKMSSVFLSDSFYKYKLLFV